MATGKAERPKHQNAAEKPRPEKLASAVPKEDPRHATRMLLEHVESEFTRSPVTESYYFTHILPARRRAFAAEIAAMEVPEELAGWAARMPLYLGQKKVKVHQDRLDWLTALMVVRYGEAINKWPDQFSQDDIDRALRWERDPVAFRPEGVSYDLKEE